LLGKPKKNLGSNREIRDREFHWGGGGAGVARMSIPEPHVARTVPHVHDLVQRKSGNCDRWQSAGSERRAGKLCEIKGARLQRQCNGLRYIYLHSVGPKYLPQHPILKHPQVVFFFKYERKIIFSYIFNFIFSKQTVRLNGQELMRNLACS
jgi:hypothetical protein